MAELVHRDDGEEGDDPDDDRHEKLLHEVGVPLSDLSNCRARGPVPRGRTWPDAVYYIGLPPKKQ